MPIYTYRCGNCGNQFDLHQRFDDPDPSTCPNCSLQQKLQRVYKPVGVVFKGSGFYATDNKTRSGSSINPASSTNGSTSAEERGDRGSEEKSKNKEESSKNEGKSKKEEGSKKEAGSQKDKPSADSKADPAPTP